jgi:hypothetical protein
MMQLTLAFTNVGLLNKINCKQQKDKANWPTGKAHSVMTVLLKEYEPKDTMAEMEMELALAKMKLGPKKEPNSLNDAMASIECQYSIEMTKGKKKAQVLRLGGVTYSSVIAKTQMIWQEKQKNLPVATLLNKMHIQWRLAGGKNRDEKGSRRYLDSRYWRNKSCNKTLKRGCKPLQDRRDNMWSMGSGSRGKL